MNWSRDCRTMVERKPRSWPSIEGSNDTRASEAFQRLEDVTRLISDWVWEIDEHGVLSYVSERIIDRLGMHPIQAVGKKFTDIGTFVDEQGQEIDGPDFKRPFRDVDFAARSHDGELRHFMLSGMPRFHADDGSFLGATGIAKDVTDIIMVERANTRLADAIEVLAGYFALYDEDDELVISNAKFKQLNKEFGPASAPGSRFEDLLRAEIDAGRYPEAFGNEEDWIRRRLARRQQTLGPFEMETSSGRWFYVDEERLPDGGTVMISNDITELKRAMSVLEANATKHREFASSVAHKLRTPLAVLRANLDNLRASDEAEELKAEVDSLTRLVEQLLTLTRYENMVLARDETCDLYALTVALISTLAPSAIKEGRNLELEAEDQPLIIQGDAGALEHAIRNLIENAIKYSTRDSDILIKLNRDPAYIRISDQGRGINPGDMTKLFEKFSQTDRRGANAGLGLNIVKVIADAHDAEVTVGQRAQGGAEFTITFPTYDKHRRRLMSI